ncbi:hypothetical protein GCM10027258_94880 [Amycolatopsis stemonae]
MGYAGMQDIPAAPGVTWTPTRAVLELLLLIARRDTARACSLFSSDAAYAFARTHSSTDCPGAVAHLASQILDPRAYRDDVLIPESAVMRIDANTKIIDACHLIWKDSLALYINIDPGPQLGMLTLQGQSGAGFMISGYLTCSTQ